ncbi:DUF6694 family lipoprotein [Sphingobacterium sp.]|uniref:DUF6694 family lipoprotein n=1 Tax=Sphingobacterium sp. TaxID=341027 RepID=UPI002FDDA05C
MKQVIKITLIGLFFILSLSSCGEKLSGKDESSFDSSRKKVEAKLNDKEKEKLEKALRVTLSEAMWLKMNEAEKYTGESINRISMGLVDGKSYSAMLDLADDILQKQQERKVAHLQNEIDSLQKYKTEFELIKKELAVFELEPVELDLEDFFGEPVPRIIVSMKYIGKQPLKGSQGFSYILKKRSTQAIISNEQSVYGESDSVLQPGESRVNTIVFSQEKKDYPKLWEFANYPVKGINLANYDLELIVSTQSMKSDAKEIILPKSSIEMINKNLKKLEAEIAALKKETISLDDLELT